MQDISVGIIGENQQACLELAAQLRLLGERVCEADSAQALFLITGPDARPPARGDARPSVLCVPSQSAAAASTVEPLLPAQIARLSLPASRANLELALALVHKVLANEALEQQNAFPEVIGVGAAVRSLKRTLTQVAGGESTVLLTGPSGTGKSFLAEAIHRRSNRREGPFVPINCGAIPAELIESELFGHEKGAFTGAIEQRLGRFELAAGGTLFLDEIGDMPFAMQVKLLRAIQERVFERVGGVRTLAADVRLIAATNVDLESRMRSGAFREDLFYRINVFPVAVPALWERKEDLPLLIDQFQKELTAQYGYAVRFGADAVAQLQRYAWPGNLRELRNLIERLTVEYGKALLLTESLPAKYRSEDNHKADTKDSASDGNSLLPINGIDLKAHLAELEQSLIEQALRDSDAVVARAADRLHIRRTTLVEKMRKYGIDRTTH